MKNIIIVASLVSLLGVSFVSAGSTNEYDSAQYLAERGIINKYELGSERYEVDRVLPRKEAVAIAREMSGIPKKEKCEGKFSDIWEGWICQSAEAMLEAGRIAANEKFRPHSQLAKPEALAMVVTSVCSVSYDEYKEIHPEFLHVPQVNPSISSVGTWTMLENFSEENSLLTENYKKAQIGSLDGYALTTRGEMFEMAELAMERCENGEVQSEGDTRSKNPTPTPTHMPIDDENTDPVL